MFFVILTLLCAFPVTQSEMGTFFIFDNIIYPSYSSWVVTYTINFIPYKKAIRNATDNVNELANLIGLFGEHNFASNYVMTNETTLFKDRLQNMLEKEIYLARQEVENIQILLEDMSQVATLKPPRRFTRALIPVLGDVLSSLFGVSTQKQLRKVKSTISDLNDDHNQLVHIVSESITLLNKSNHEIQSNRQAINTLNTAIKTIIGEYENQYMRLHEDIYNNWVATRSITVLQSSFHVVEAHLRDIYQEVVNLRRNLEFAFKGQLTVDLIPPDRLLSLLNRIQESVPYYVKLPYPISRDNLLKYYQLIKPTVLPDHYKSHVILALPLVHTNSSYEVYHTVQVPSPNVDSQLGAYYNLEDNYLVISPLRNYYALLTLEEYNTCKHAPICKFSSPIYSISKNPTCISSLFLRDFLLIDKYCTKSLVVFPQMPIVRHMFARHYVIAPPSELTLTTHCPDSSPETQSISSVEHIVIPDGCSLTCDYFTIPPNYYGNSNIEQESRIENDVNLAKLVDSIWSTPSLLPFHNSSALMSLNLTKLSDVKDIPVSHLQTLLANNMHESRKRVRFHQISYLNVPLLLCMIVTLLVLFLACILFARRRRPRRKTIKKIVRKEVRFANNSDDSEACEIIDTNLHNSDSPNKDEGVRVDAALAKGLLQSA